MEEKTAMMAELADGFSEREREMKSKKLKDMVDKVGRNI